MGWNLQASIKKPVSSNYSTQYDVVIYRYRSESEGGDVTGTNNHKSPVDFMKTIETGSSMVLRWTTNVVRLKKKEVVMSAILPIRISNVPGAWFF